MPHDSSTISAVIIARNDEATIRRCIKSVLEQYARVHEIIVVEGNSTDHTYRFAADLARKHDVINLVFEDPEADEHGPAAARNIGAALATGDLLLFLNGDVTIGPDYVTGLLELMDKRGLDAAAGLRWNVRESLVSGLMNVHYALNYDSSSEMLRSPAYLSSDAMVIKAESFWSVGGYDANMPAGEDADLGYRLRGNGSEIAYDRDAMVWHEGRHYGSVIDWFQQLKDYGRGAASLALAHSWRLDRERSALHRNVVRPVSFGLLFLLVAIVLANVLGPLTLALGAVVTTGAGFRYVRAAARVQQQCESINPPTQLLPQDIMFYPLFKYVRNAALSVFTWQSLLSTGEPERARRTEDGTL